jgi:hypothetical protein
MSVHFCTTTRDRRYSNIVASTLLAHLYIAEVFSVFFSEFSAGNVE